VKVWAGEEIKVPDGAAEGHIGDVGLVAECMGCEGLRSRERCRDIGIDIDPVVFLALGPMDSGEDDAQAVRRLGRVLRDLHGVEDGIGEDMGAFPDHLDHVGELEIVQGCRVGVEVIEAFER